MSFFPWKKKKKIEMIETPTGQINQKTYKNFIVKAIGFIAKQGAARGEFTEPEYNLAEIKAAADADSYIKMALMKYSYLVYKAGYQLKGQNEKAVEYIKMRFRIMSFATGKPMDVLFQEIADDLIKYSNAFLIKSRVNKLMPGVNAKGVFGTYPIGGYFRIDPASMKIKRDQNGTIQSYEQSTDSGTTKTFQPTDVIHFYMDKDPNNAFGTPRIIAALEDVKLLRKIEGNIISLVYRFAIPIYQWMIGRPENGFQATDKEIEEAQKEIENMPLDGVIVTNEKTQIKAVGAEGKALDASDYLTYFERRVFSALGVSDSQMGRGGSKQDADSMEAQAHDTVKYIQRVISTFNESYIIDELLLEGGFNPITNEDDIVDYVFNEISIETKIKVENHEMLKYQSNLISFDEARKAIGKKPDVDESRLYVNMIDNKSAIAQIKAKTEGSLEIAKASALQNTGAGASGNGQTKSTSSSASKAVKNNNMPQNQHGTGSVKVKENSLELADEDEIQEVELIESVSIKEKTSYRNHKKIFSAVYKKYENLRNDITGTDADLNILFPLSKDSIMSDIKAKMQLKAYDGVEKAVFDINKDSSIHHLIPNVNISLDQFYDEVESTLGNILKDIKKRIGSNRDSTTVTIIFNTLEYRLRFLLEFIMPKVYWYAYVKTGAYLGINKAYIKFDNSNDAENHPAEINTHAFSVDHIPAYHSFCDCKVSFKAGDKD